MLATSAPIARLRSLGCTVSRVIGHDAQRGEIVLSVTFPAGAHLMPQLAHGNARAQARRGEHRMIVSTPGYGMPDPGAWSRAERRQYATATQVDAAFILGMIADHIADEQQRAGVVDSFPVYRLANFDGRCLDFEHSNLGARQTVELISYLLAGRSASDLPDLYEGAARALIAIGVLRNDGSLGPNGADYLDSLEG